MKIAVFWDVLTRATQPSIPEDGILSIKRLVRGYERGPDTDWPTDRRS
jgi:hypothetical protein